MTFFLVLATVVLLLTVLAALALADRTPDTHAEVTRHGDYRF